MYTNRVDTGGNPIIEINEGNYPNDYEIMNCFDVIFCPCCGTLNLINLDWCGGVKGLIFCEICGAEIQ